MVRQDCNYVMPVCEQYCAEYDVLADGKNPDEWDDGSFPCFFEETCGGLFVPRNLPVNLELNVIDDVRNGDLANLFHPKFLSNWQNHHKPN